MKSNRRSLLCALIALPLAVMPRPKQAAAGNALRRKSVIPGSPEATGFLRVIINGVPRYIPVWGSDE